MKAGELLKVRKSRGLLLDVAEHDLTPSHVAEAIDAVLGRLDFLERERDQKQTKAMYQRNGEQQ